MFCRPIRQEYVDDLIWQQVLQLLHTPELVRAEIERRVQAQAQSSPVQQRKENVSGEGKLEGWLDLRINREKTRSLDLRQSGQSLDFLGYTFRYDRDH